MLSKKILFSVVLLVFGFLYGCKQGVRPDRDLNHLSSSSYWSIKGKISFSDGVDGGSGRFIWHYKNKNISASLKAPLGQGSWLLEELSDGAASLIVGSKQKFTSHDAGSLLSQQIGWLIPWQAFKSWLMLTPFNETSQVRFDDKVMILNEMGWQVEFNKWSRISGLSLPMKITAKNPPYMIKLSIKEWQVNR